MSFVRFIQDLTGAPNDAKWNSVLFGGKRNHCLSLDLFSLKEIIS